MKAAINLITLILSKEHDGKKVTFNTICPGKIIKNYQHKRRRNKNMRKYITSEILSRKIFYIYFNTGLSAYGRAGVKENQIFSKTRQVYHADRGVGE